MGQLNCAIISYKVLAELASQIQIWGHHTNYLLDLLGSHLFRIITVYIPFLLPPAFSTSRSTPTPPACPARRVGCATLVTHAHSKPTTTHTRPRLSRFSPLHRRGLPPNTNHPPSRKSPSSFWTLRFYILILFRI
jgi:hypothetical protein